MTEPISRPPPGDGIDRDRGRIFLHNYRLIVIAKKCNNLLTKQAVVPPAVKDAFSFALLLQRECARVRWLTDNTFTTSEDA